MHAEDYAMQTAGFYFACIWIISWLGLALIYGIYRLIDKMIKWWHREKVAN